MPAMRETARGVRSLPVVLLLLLLATLLLTVPDMASAQFGVTSFDSSLSSLQAGAHADFSTGFTLEREALGNPIGQLRDASVTLPAGLIGDPLALERCSIETLESLDCGAASQVGSIELATTECHGIAAKLTSAAEAGATTITVPNADAFCSESSDNLITVGEGVTAEEAYVATVIDPTTLQLAAPLKSSHSAGEAVTHVATSTSASLPLFNVQPSPGHVATFATSVALTNLVVQVDMDAAGRLVATIGDESTLLPLLGATVTLWGVPASTSHNALRCRELDLECDLEPPEPAVAFMTNPSSCDGAPQEVALSLTSWQGQSASSATKLPAMTGCEKLMLAPSMTVTATSTRRESTAGYEVDLKVPTDEDPYGLATPALEKVSVSFPDGTSLTPAFANAIQPCNAIQLAHASCPDDSRIGSAEAVSPALAEPLRGSLYVGTPTSTRRLPVDLSLEVNDVAIEIPGEVVLDQATGQVTTSFVDLPQLPLENLKLSLFNGTLVNPLACGPATSSAVAESYAGAVLHLTSTFNIDENSEGGACAPAAFSPSFTAGTTHPLAGEFSPMTIALRRPDGQQDLAGFTVKLPAGLVGLVQKIAPCLEPAAALGICQPGARIGTATITAGPGSLPLVASGPVYLTGPYAGAPLGLEILASTVGGPFDPGGVLVRSRVLVNPKTLALTISSGLPQSLDGIPLRLRAVELTLDRQGFILNPSTCSPQSITATITSSEGAAVNLSTPFRVADCSRLGFAPHLSAATQAHVSAEGDGASLSFRLVNPGGAQATLGSLAVKLPSQLRPRLHTLESACMPAGAGSFSRVCAPTAAIGHITVNSPVAPRALTGSIYLIAHGADALPSLAAVLEGDGFEVDLEGALSLARDGIAVVTFRGLPDVPISSIVVSLPRGPHSILGAVARTCSKAMFLGYTLVDHGGAQASGRTRVLVPGCRRRAAVSKQARRSRRRP